MIKGTFYTFDETVNELALSHRKLAELTEKGRMPHHKIKDRLLYDASDIDDLKRILDILPTISEIARMYGMSRQAVHFAFRHEGLEPDGYSKLKRNAAVYHIERVKEFAKARGWELQIQD